MSQLLSTGEVAKMTGAALWQVARLFEEKTVAEPINKIGRSRAISREELPAIIRELARRGWLKKTVTLSQAELQPTV